MFQSKDQSILEEDPEKKPYDDIGQEEDQKKDW